MKNMYDELWKIQAPAAATFLKIIFQRILSKEIKAIKPHGKPWIINVLQKKLD
jgi:hypothetical protein